MEEDLYRLLKNETIFKILKQLAAAKEPLSLSELAEHTALKLSDLYVILGELLRFQLVTLISTEQKTDMAPLENEIDFSVKTSLAYTQYQTTLAQTLDSLISDAPDIPAKEMMIFTRHSLVVVNPSLKSLFKNAESPEEIVSRLKK